MESQETGRNWIRMEESEGGSPVLRRQIGFVSDRGTPRDDDDDAKASSTWSPLIADLARSLAQERLKIIDNDKLTARQKRMLLEENRKAITVATGGTVTKTDSVVYGILLFGGVLLITLALLTAFYGLPKEVLLSFVGTVLGGVIATIAQKLGKI
jgi:hypothetical protein